MVTEHLGIIIDYTRDNDLPEQGKAMLTRKGFYKMDHENSPQESFARAATCFSFGDYEFAQRIYDYASKGDFTFASPPLSNSVEVNWPTFSEDQFEEAGDWLEENIEPNGMPISCFVKGTPVFTKNGIKNIEDIVKGDEVLTHKGRFRKVLATKESQSDDIYSLQCSANRTEVGVTGNHLMLTNNGWKRVDQLRKGQDLIAQSNSLDKECEVSDLVIQSLYTVKNGAVTASNGLLKYVQINTVNKQDSIKTTVYDIQVEEDESFSVAGMIAHNCFLAMISDNKKALVETRSEVSWLSMMGGGIGIYTAQRSPDEKSTGVMQHMRGYDADTLAYKQTSSRRGSIAAYMDITHPEIMQFLQMRNPIGGDSNTKCFNLNNAVNITDDFMGKVVRGENYEIIDPKHGGTGKHLNAREVWELIMELRFETGEPYLCFVDTINRNLPKWITRPLYHVRQSNLCVAPETLILTKQGHKAIESLEGEKVEVWNGKEWSKVEVMLTGCNRELLTVSTECGKELQCTPYHKFYINDDHQEVRALNLNAGDKLSTYSLPDEDNIVVIIKSVINNGRRDDTFCFTEPKRGMGVFNGLLAGQCSEITLMTSLKRTAVCCLSSANLARYDHWKDTQMIADLIRFLDNVLEYFIRLAPPELKRAIHSARKERSLGLGTLGWHSYLQDKMIAFESDGFDGAVMHTEMIYEDIKEKAVAESLRLGALRGEAPDCLKSGMRNAHLMAIAPNASSSSIVNVSPSIEPWNSNAFNAEGRAGSFLIKNKYLERELVKLNMNTADIWKSIVLSEGSVQHLEGIPDNVKEVFKTAEEIDPNAIIDQAAVRQRYICQSQSLNIFVPKDITLGEMSDLHIKAWFSGVKTMYYCRSKPASRVKVGDGGKRPLNSVDIEALSKRDNDCTACEG